ncbi:hypothetical protein BM536_029050 [Streptomyces phaeoluteigriseus]|uniref:Uncharacterized protein n=1 Tax=Streptomyces phaeoluteigriseus TaxID=114686 RepID=A0A1V6MLZ7_9ACTN|nr:hypothetical protein BM536_029050 [Streptomyces phaeoluteigriseus]
MEVSFTTAAAHSLPAAILVEVGDGERWAPVTGAAVAWADTSDRPAVVTFDASAVVTFDAVRGSRPRLTLTSSRPGEVQGAVRISRLEA